MASGTNSLDRRDPYVEILRIADDKDATQDIVDVLITGKERKDVSLEIFKDLVGQSLNNEVKKALKTLRERFITVALGLEEAKRVRAVDFAQKTCFITDPDQAAWIKRSDSFDTFEVVRLR